MERAAEIILNWSIWQVKPKDQAAGAYTRQSLPQFVVGRTDRQAAPSRTPQITAPVPRTMLAFSDSECGVYMPILTDWRSIAAHRFTQPASQIETKMIASSALKAYGVHSLEWADETRSRCLLVSSKDSAHLKTIIGILHDHGIQTEEGLHRPWRSASFESSVMVSPEDYPKASVLYEELEIPPGTGPKLVSILAPSRLRERGKRKFLPEFFARHKQPEPTDSGRSWENRASG
jgi:hypothetical protein